jgi:putative NADH-flavin reductase
MTASKPLIVGIIGPAGFGGSYLSVELLNRGHTVVGISRNPETLGKHARYIPRPVDIDAVSISQLAESFQGLDILVSMYGPHTCKLTLSPFLSSRNLAALKCISIIPLSISADPGRQKGDRREVSRPSRPL